MATSIKVGDHFTDRDYPGCTFVCDEVDEEDRTLRHHSVGGGWHNIATCTRIHPPLIRPIKTRKVKLMAWLMGLENYSLTRSTCQREEHRYHACVNIGDAYAYAFRATASEAIRSVRRQLRAKGVKL